MPASLGEPLKRTSTSGGSDHPPRALLGTPRWEDTPTQGHSQEAAMLARAAALLLVLGSLFGVAPPAQAAVACDGHRATLVGTRGDDVLIGTRGDDVIAGLTGSDSIDGRGGNDRICGGYGADQLRGGPGWDRVFGGPDRVAFDDEGSASIGDTLRGGPGRDRLLPRVGTPPRGDGEHHP